MTMTIKIKIKEALREEKCMLMIKNNSGINKINNISSNKHSRSCRGEIARDLEKNKKCIHLGSDLAVCNKTKSKYKYTCINNMKIFKCLIYLY